MTNLQLTHLRFDAHTTTDITLGNHFAGSNLRNALAAVLRRTTCPDANGRSTKPDATHLATCPACWILAAENTPGSVVRPYTIIPPLPAQRRLPANTRFSFGLTIFGSGFQFLPHFVLALSEVGQEGLGPGRGTFHITNITAINPFLQQTEPLLDPHNNLVQIPTLHVTWPHIQPAIARWQEQLAPQNNFLTLTFHTPLRLDIQKRPIQTPDFGVLFQRLLYRLDDLTRHFAHEDPQTAPRRDRTQVAQLHALANQVRHIDSQTHWHELHSHSSRRGGKTPFSGLTGTATYHTHNWQPLLPFLLFGQALHVGKLAVKGNGLYHLNHPTHSYWNPFTSTTLHWG